MNNLSYGLLSGTDFSILIKSNQLHWADQVTKSVNKQFIVAILVEWMVL